MRESLGSAPEVQEARDATPDAGSREETSSAERVASPAPVIAATWQSRPAVDAWAPDALTAALPWTGELAYEDTSAREIRDGQEWHLLGILHRGRVHAHNAAHREDAMALLKGERGFAMVAADGAGSARLSRVGSECVCRSAMRAARGFLEETTAGGASHDEQRIRNALREALTLAVDEISTAAAALGATPKDFRSTALICIASERLLGTVQVGDGAILLESLDGSVRRCVNADGGDYSGEVSLFVPELEGVDIDARITITPLRDVRSILLVTDGIEDPFYPLDKRGREVLDQLYEGVSSPASGFSVQPTHGAIAFDAEALPRLRQWIAFERRGENDDRSLVGAFRHVPAALR